MSRPCGFCGRVGQLEPVTVTDRSGAALARLCGRCRALMKHARCRLCGAPKFGESKAGDVVEYGRGDDGGPICDDCRSEVLFVEVRRC